MKMIYHSKIDPNRKRILLIIISITLILALFRYLFPIQFSQGLIFIGQPFMKIGNGLSSLVEGRSQKELSNQINELQMKLNDRNLLKDENVKLKELLGRYENSNGILAVVVSKPTVTPYDTFIIDVGTNEGIGKGDRVLAGSSTAIGFVSETYPAFSRVTSYSSPNYKYPVYVGEGSTQLEAIGQGNGTFKIVLPEGSDVKVGDNIFLPSISPILFGVVEKIIPSDQPSFQNILFQTPVDLNGLYYVYVVK